MGLQLVKRIVFASFFLALAPLVRAQEFGYQIRRGLDGIGEILEPFLTALLSSEGFDEYLFVRVLLAIIVFFVVQASIGNVPRLKDNKGIVTIISLAVTVLSVRYLGEYDIIYAILIPYSVLGIAISTILPFLIYFFFVHYNISSPSGRKLAWSLYAIILTGLWIYRYDEIGTIGNYIYLGIIGVAVAMMLLDKTVQEYFALFSVRREHDAIRNRHILDCYSKYYNASDMYYRATEGSQPQQLAKSQMDILEKRLRHLGVKGKL